MDSGLLSRLKRGWTYHIWRGTVPSNRWLQPLRYRNGHYDIHLGRDAVADTVIVAEYGTTINNIWQRRSISEHVIRCLVGAPIDLLNIRCWNYCGGRFIPYPPPYHNSGELHCSKCNTKVKRHPGKI